MPTLAQMIEKVASPDRVGFVVIGLLNGYGDPEPWQLDYGLATPLGFHEGDMPLGIILPWASGSQWLEYDPEQAGYLAIYAWTATKIILTSQYDGHRQIHAIPRFPEACMPEMFGG